jgi:hypothetical protein
MPWYALLLLGGALHADVGAGKNILKQITLKNLVAVIPHGREGQHQLAFRGRLILQSSSFGLDQCSQHLIERLGDVQRFF